MVAFLCDFLQGFPVDILGFGDSGFVGFSLNYSCGFGVIGGGFSVGNSLNSSLGFCLEFFLVFAGGFSVACSVSYALRFCI